MAGVAQRGIVAVSHGLIGRTMLKVQLPSSRDFGQPGSGGNRPLRILCLGAHSDDIEIGAAGTIAALLRQHPDSQVSWVVCSASDVRVEEARSSATELLVDAGEVDIRFMGLRENYLNVGSDAKEAFEELRSALAHEPDVIFTHALHDRHQDHEAVARLTWNTWRQHLVLEYEIPKYEGDLRTPNVYVQLSPGSVEAKLSHLERHFPSQHGKGWYDRDAFLALLRIRGLECQSPTRFAEAFHGRKVVLDVGS